MSLMLEVDTARAIQPLNDEALLALLQPVARERKLEVRVLARRIVKQRRDWRGDRLFEVVTVTTQRGTVDLFAKYCEDTPSERGSPLHAPAREISIYRDVLPGGGFGTAEFWNALEESGRSVLVVEYVHGRRLKRYTDAATWYAAAEWLGHLHARFSHISNSRLETQDASFYIGWAERAMNAVARISTAAAAVLEPALAHYDRVAKPLASAPQALIHGEFYCTNILIGHSGGLLRICPFDWETAARGPGALDLAYLLRQKSGIPESDMATRYLRGWQENGGDALSMSELLDLIDRCRIHELMYALWSAASHREASAEKLTRRSQRVRELVYAL